MVSRNVILLPHQDDFVHCDAAHPAICGGLGSGKTEAGIWRTLRLLLSDSSSNVLYAMPTYDLLKLRAIAGFEDKLAQLGVGYSLNKTEYTIKIDGYGSIYFRSYDRPERLVAFEVAHTILDELDTLDKVKAAYVWQKVTERTRQHNVFGKNTVASVTTPDAGVNGFSYSKWGKTDDAEYVLINAKTTDNPFLPAGYVDQIRKNYDPKTADAMINGLFVSFSEHNVYHFYDPEKHDTARKAEANDRLHIGLDFNVGGTCATVWVCDGDKTYAVDEFVSHDTHDFVLQLKRRYKNKVVIYPDASGAGRSTNASATDIEILRNAGYHVDAPDSNPYVRDRVNSVNAMLSHDRLFINRKLCPELSFAMSTQGYDDAGVPQKYNDHPAIDDWCDCSGYFISRKFPVTSGLIKNRLTGV